MSMRFEKGKLITFEGIEGAGKSTQIPLIADWLRQKGKDVITTREPGGTVIGEKIRTLLLNDSMDDLTELLLIFAARAEHIAKVIQPALNQGQWVLCDRFTEASYAYQGSGRQLGFSRIAYLEKEFQHGLQPFLTFWFDLPINIGLERIKQRHQMTDRFESERHSFFERVKDGYTARAQAEPKRIQHIDAMLPIQDVTQHILKIITTLCLP